MSEIGLTRRVRRQLIAILDERKEFAGSAAELRVVAACDRFWTLVRQFPRSGTIIQSTENFEFRRFPVDNYFVTFRVEIRSDFVVIADIRSGVMRAVQISQI